MVTRGQTKPRNRPYNKPYNVKNIHKKYKKWCPPKPQPKPSLKHKVKRYVKTGSQYVKESVKSFKNGQLQRDLAYEQGRRDVKYQLPVRSTHSVATTILGVNVPKPMWEKGGGRRSYTSTYKSRRQARSSAHRAKLQRGGF
jgi:hypothetical protein